MDVPPVKDAIVMNVGDLMMRWSNGSIHMLYTWQNYRLTLCRYSEIHGPSRFPAPKAGSLHGR